MVAHQCEDRYSENITELSIWREPSLFDGIEFKILFPEDTCNPSKGLNIFKPTRLFLKKSKFVTFTYTYVKVIGLEQKNNNIQWIYNQV